MPSLVMSPKRRSSSLLWMLVVLGELLVRKKISSFLVVHHAVSSRQQPYHLAKTTAASASSFGMKKMSSATTSDSTTTTKKTIAVPPPPVARRDEDGYVLAGKLRPSDPGYHRADKETKPPIRQSVDSEEKLLDPPVKISDPYGWMRDESRTNREVLDHLNNENAYTERITGHLGDLRKNLYDEMVAGIEETDFTVPSPKDGYLYYSRTYKGKSYLSHCRAPLAGNPDWVEASKRWDGTAGSPVLRGEVAYLDVNRLAEGQTYCATGAIETSPSSELVAYTVDFSGDEVTRLFVENLATGEIVDHDSDLRIYGAISWGDDDETLFYLKMDDRKRPFRLYRRIIGKSDSDGKPDELLYQEDDELYWVGLSKSFDGKYIFVSSRSGETTEIHFLDLRDPGAELRCVAKRRKKVLYDVDHRSGYWYISTNVGGTPNTKLMVSEAVADSEDLWKDMEFNGEKLFDGGCDRSIDGIKSFARHSVVCGRSGGLPRVWVIAYDGVATSNVTGFVRLGFDEDACDVRLGPNLDCTADSVVVAYDSLVTPLCHIGIPLDAPTDLSARTVLKEQEVPGYDKSRYSCERTTVLSRDGETEIPVSIVCRTDAMEKVTERGETVPTHLYGYGSYGACVEASFRATRRTLLDRGVVYAIAHVRGGGEMGRRWYEGAKYLCKKNTFDDFVDVGRWLTTGDRKITTPQQLSCEGRSAGGLLIGASINQAPELFKVALLGVPFVDVVPTMIDASIPLTVAEWEEWGNPNEEKYHGYMMEYSPTNNVQKNATYPSCLLTGGLYDPRVQYWEPCKLAAEIRHKSNPETSGPCCTRIDMASGHFTASDRYKHLKELAFEYAFVLDRLGLAE